VVMTVAVMLGETDCGGSWWRCGVIGSFWFPVQVAIRHRNLPSSPSRLSRGYNRGPRGADAACADAHEPVAHSQRHVRTLPGHDALQKIQWHARLRAADAHDGRNAGRGPMTQMRIRWA